MIGRGVFGAINVGGHRMRRFTADDADLLRTIGQQVCAWVEHAQLYAATSRHLMELKAIHDTGRATSSSLNLDERLQALLERLARAAGAQRAMVGLMDALDATHCRLCVGYDTSKADPWLRHLDLSSEQYPEIQEVVRTRQPLVIPDIFIEPLLVPVREQLDALGLRSLVVLPLLVREQAIGVLSLGYVGQGRTFTADEIRFCQSMADLSAASIANAQLFDQVARAKAEWENTFDAIPDLVAIVDAENRLVRVNCALAKRLDVAPDRLVGQPCYAVLDGAKAAWHGCPHSQTLITGQPTTLEVEDPHLGGTFLITTSPLMDPEGQLVGCVHIARDITELKRLEEEARQRQRFEDLSRAKSAFIATMSHELRTPLNSILGFSELMLGQAVGPLTEKQSRYLGHIHEGGKHLLDLINDILDVSRVEAGKIELTRQPVLLDEAVEATLALARSQADKAGISLTADLPTDLPRVLADPVRLKQILFNLVSNAVKFTPSGGLITVAARRASARTGEPESRGNGEAGMGGTGEAAAPTPRFTDSPIHGERDSLEIRVQDTGIGIRPEDMPRLFQEFVQLETTQAQRHEGTGLGLALTKKLVELHGGRIWVESQGEGRGTTFAFTLPFAGSAGVRRET